MIKGLQAIFREPIGAALLAELRARGVQAIRADCQKLGAASTAVIVDEVMAAGLHCLPTVYDAEDSRMLQTGAFVEFRGEPDIGHPSHYADTQPIPPAEYRRLLFDFYAESVRRGHQVLAPGISNLNQRGLAWLRATDPSTWPEDIGVSVHRYPNGDSPTTPHSGFRSRENEVETLKNIIGKRPWMVSEFGYTSAQRATRWERLFGVSRKWTDAQVAEFVAWEWSFWARMGATGSVLYQLNDGPSSSTLDRYGIRRLDGTWKPVAASFRGER